MVVWRCCSPDGLPVSGRATGFIPSVDTGQLNGQIEAMQASASTRWWRTRRRSCHPCEGRERGVVHLELGGLAADGSTWT